MSIMLHAGYLNDELKIKGGAVEIFFRHRDEFIDEKISTDQNYEALPRGEYIRDRDQFPTFFINWIDGIYVSCLKILNHIPVCASPGDYKGQFNPPPPPIGPSPGPIHDPYFVFSKMPPDVGAMKPSLDATGIAAYFGFPGPAPTPTSGEQQVANLFGINLTPPPADAVGVKRFQSFKTGMATLHSEKYSKVDYKNFIPDVASEQFPNLDYGDSELTIEQKQEAVFKAVAQSFDDVVTEILKQPMVFLSPIALGGLTPSIPKTPTGQESPGLGLQPIFNLAKQKLDANFPKPLADNGLTILVNYEALKRALVKPLYLAAIGVVFGSHPEGFLNKMGNVSPDAITEFNNGYKDVSPVLLKFEEPKKTTPVGDDGVSDTTIEDDEYENIRADGKILYGNESDEPRAKNPRQLPAKSTPFTCTELMDAFFKADKSLYDVKRNNALFHILVGQVGLETGGEFKTMNYVLAGIKKTKNQHYTYFSTTEYLTQEELNTVKGPYTIEANPSNQVNPVNKKPQIKIKLHPEAPGCRFNAFTSLVAGARFYLWFIKKLGLFNEAMTGDEVAYVRRARKVKYMTASEESYAQAIRFNIKKYKDEIDEFLANI